MSKAYFITSSIPYVNSKPHIGHAQEFALADALARHYKQQNSKVVFQSGTDDNASKNVLSAKEAGVSPKIFIDQNSKKFEELLTQLNIKPDLFVRTSSSAHAFSVQYFLKQLNPDDVYLSNYVGLYCQGCEDFYFENDLTKGLCPDHKTAPQRIKEQNIFFKLSRYQDTIFKLVESDQIQITPRSKKNEILKFVASGLTDISLSRSSSRNGGWGIPYPDQPDQVVYVWIDALINYLSGLGYGHNLNWKETWNEDTNKIHVVGKNVWKFHAIYWVALLLSAGLSLPNELVIHGFLTNEGVKISKTLGNGADPSELIFTYGIDAVRFYLLHSLSVYEDSDFIEAHIKNVYNSELANKLGNLTSRILTLKNKVPEFDWKQEPEKLNTTDFKSNSQIAFRLIETLNKEINQTKPWQLLKVQTHDVLIIHLKNWLNHLNQIADLLEPIIPNGCAKLTSLLGQPKHLPILPLYPRK